MTRMLIPPTERFWEKVEKAESCWIWLGAIHSGYGNFMVSKKERKWVDAHRFAYEELVGPIPDGLVLDHLCRNRACVNPDHLEPVSTKENILRGAGIAARNAKATHCQNGHEFTPENTGRRKRKEGGRVCLICRRANSAKVTDKRRMGLLAYPHHGRVHTPTDST